MKLLASILSIYVICLIAWPCQDEIPDQCRQLQHETHQNSGGHEQDNCHCCSPFCICSCCQANSLVSLNYFALFTNEIPVKINVFHKITHFPEISLSVWVPPKAA